MAAPNMRHFNSADEVAKRSAAGEAPREPKGFKHFNSPEERAKRGELQTPGVGAVKAPKRVVQTTAAPWPPPGLESNNAPVPEKPAAAPPAPLAPPASGAAPSDSQQERRLHRLEQILFTFCESLQEARQFRLLLNNQQAVTDSQATLGRRLMACENTLEALLAEDDDAHARADEPPPSTNPDNPKPTLSNETT